jgi:predicted nuclease of predicted toxin-antitoxin system
MRVLADENLFEPIIQYLRDQGHEVLSVRETDLSGASDDEVYAKAVRERLTIITMDKDFMRRSRFFPEACAGIVVAKIYRRTVEESTKIFIQRFQQVWEKAVVGNLVILTPEGVKVRTSLKR